MKSSGLRFQLEGIVRHALVIIWGILVGGTAALGQALPSQDAHTKLHDLFEENWQWRLKELPIDATFLGDHRYDDRLTDLSFEAIDRRKAHDREMLARIQQIDRSTLSSQEVLSYDLFLRDKQEQVERQRYPQGLIGTDGNSFEWTPISQLHGPHLGFPKLVDAMPFVRMRDYENYLARLVAFPVYIDQLVALLKRSIESGWVLPGEPLRSVPMQIEQQIEGDVTKSQFYKPFVNFPSDFAETDRLRLAAAGERALTASFFPALRKLNTFIRDTYLPACRKDIAASSLPGGSAFYESEVRRRTTTKLTPNEIHQLGQREVARIRREMERVIEQVGFRGSWEQFLNFLHTEPRFYYTRPEDLVTGYRDIAKRADAELPRLFAELPRTPYGVREILPYEAPQSTTAYYGPGALDGSRAGYFWVNTYKLSTRPKYEMEALTLHEAVPGHHLQFARARELTSVPDFRRTGRYTAYSEGWGLYAESLGVEMGFYTDPYSNFGRLMYEMWRACRLVVDTGMHAFGWSRQKAIDFMKENTGLSENNIVAEIDRYIVWPGQALAYKIGELKIKELRAKASSTLGAKFDIRKFHNAVLDDGPLPLELLEKRIDEWTQSQQ